MLIVVGTSPSPHHWRGGVCARRRARLIPRVTEPLERLGELGVALRRVDVPRRAPLPHEVVDAVVVDTWQNVTVCAGKERAREAPQQAPVRMA